MWLKNLCFFFLLVISSFSLASSELLNESLKDNLAQPELISGTFKQNKYFKVLKQPIKSSGVFYLDPKLGFYWQTQKPVNSAIFLKSGELMEKDYRGKVKQIAGGGTLASVLIKAISGDISALKNDFNLVKLDGSEYLELTPKQDTLRQAISKIEIYGSVQPNSIKLFEAKGNKTEIQLNYHSNPIIPEAVRAQLQ